MCCVCVAECVLMALVPDIQKTNRGRIVCQLSPLRYPMPVLCTCVPLPDRLKCLRKRSPWLLCHPFSVKSNWEYVCMCANVCLFFSEWGCRQTTSLFPCACNCPSKYLHEVDFQFFSLCQAGGRNSDAGTDFMRTFS